MFFFIENKTAVYNLKTEYWSMYFTHIAYIGNAILSLSFVRENFCRENFLFIHDFHHYCYCFSSLLFFFIFISFIFLIFLISHIIKKLSLKKGDFLSPFITFIDLLIFFDFHFVSIFFFYHNHTFFISINSFNDHSLIPLMCLVPFIFYFSCHIFLL